MSNNYLYPYSALVQGAANDDTEAALAGLLYSQSVNRSVRVSPSSAILLMRHVMSLNEKIKKAEAHIAELEKAKTIDTAHSKRGWSEAHAQEERAKKSEAELAALRGAAVPVAEIKMFPFPGCKFGERRPAMAWVGKQDKDFPVGTKFYTHPAPPVVVLPEDLAHLADDHYLRAIAEQKNVHGVTASSIARLALALLPKEFCRGKNDNN